MCAQAVIAVDGPNVLVTMEKLFGREAKLNYSRLREFLLKDAGLRLQTDDFESKSAVFLQTSPKLLRNIDAGPTEGRIRFEKMLTESGWQVFTKPPAHYPHDLVAVSRGLDYALSTHGERAVREVERALREIEAASATDCNCVATDAQSTLRDSARTLIKVYGMHYNLVSRLMLRVVLSVLVSFCRFEAAQSLLEKLLIKAWINISLAERNQAEYEQRVREHLAIAFASPLRWPGKREDLLVDPANMSRDQLLHTANRVRRALTSQRDELHRVGNVDDLLSEWVRVQIKPDVSGRPHLPAVVYLVGNDYRNHLVLAERLRRYGAQVVLVLQPCHLARTSADKQSEVSQYPVLPLDLFVDVGCPKKVAA